MMLSRRQLLAAVPAAVVLAACGTKDRTQINVRDHGAAGNGTTDDTAAILAAAAAVKAGTSLYFPKGSYRFTQHNPPVEAAIAIRGVSDFDITFESGAELVMDNLDPGDRTGTGHGVLIKGGASRFQLRNIKIRWAQKPSRRSFGDGIRILGYPTLADGSAPDGWNGLPTPVDWVTITDCEVLSSPQAGVILVGVSDIEVTGLRVQDSHADGLHFNACRRAKVDNLNVVNAGDDGLALVTYYTEDFAVDTGSQEFSFAALNDWSDADITATNVTVLGGEANGVRLAGVNRVSITGLTVTGMHKGAGVVVDSAAPGSDTGWFYVASRGVELEKLVFDDCEMGVQLLARPGASANDLFTNFEVTATDVTIRNCDNWSVRAESLTPERAKGLKLVDVTCESTATTGGHGGVGLGNMQDVDLGSLSIRHAHPVVVFDTVNSTGFHADVLQIAISEQAPQPIGSSPCAKFESSAGVITELDISWPKAPKSWIPLWANQGGVCGDPIAAAQVAIATLKIDPVVPARLFGCTQPAQDPPG